MGIRRRNIFRLGNFSVLLVNLERVIYIYVCFYFFFRYNKYMYFNDKLFKKINWNLKLYNIVLDSNVNLNSNCILLGI